MNPESSKPAIPPLGAHTSIAGGVFNAIIKGQKISASVVQIFSKNQRQWQGREYSAEELEKYFAAREAAGVEPVIIHDSYLINLAHPDKTAVKKTIDAFADEMRRASILKIPYLLTHPGSHMGAGETAGIEQIAKSLLQTWETASIKDVDILLETTAGQGSNLGWRFQHLRDIIDLCGDIEARIGVCIDTCHIFAAGYDIRALQAWEKTIAEFDKIIGLKKLKAFHLNDSLKELGSRRDRHARIGQGEIGVQGFKNIVNDPRVNHLPMIMEIPGGPGADREDLALLRSLVDYKEQIC